MVSKKKFFILPIFYYLMISAWMMIFSCGWCSETPDVKTVQASEDSVFLRISHSVKKVKTLSSAFEQERRTTMLKEAMISKGRFLFLKPDKIRWETIDPSPYGFSVNGQSVRRWQERSDVFENITLSDAPFLQALIQQIFAWTSADFSSLKERYEIKIASQDPLQIELYPLMTGERDYIDGISLVFSPELTYVTNVKIKEKKGDEIEIRFLNAVVNEPIAEDNF